MAAANNEAMASFISKRLHELQDRKNQKDIADRAGYANQNMITHLKNGSAKLSLDRVADLAAALEVDAFMLLKMAILQYVSDDQKGVVADLLANSVSENELAILKFIRQLNGDVDQPLNDRMKNTLTRAFKDLAE